MGVAELEGFIVLTFVELLLTMSRVCWFFKLSISLGLGSVWEGMYSYSGLGVKLLYSFLLSVIRLNGLFCFLQLLLQFCLIWYVWGWEVCQWRRF